MLHGVGRLVKDSLCEEVYNSLCTYELKEVRDVKIMGVYNLLNCYKDVAV